MSIATIYAQSVCFVFEELKTEEAECAQELNRELYRRQLKTKATMHVNCVGPIFKQIVTSVAKATKLAAKFQSWLDEGVNSTNAPVEEVEDNFDKASTVMSRLNSESRSFRGGYVSLGAPSQTTAAPSSGGNDLFGLRAHRSSAELPPAQTQDAAWRSIGKRFTTMHSPEELMAAPNATPLDIQCVT